MTKMAWDEQRPPELDLIKDCVHCGFCLPTCPSYAVFEDEMDSPRGRILLMRIGHEEGETISPEMVTHFDRCLGCMACVTACPSGVQYDKLIEARAAADRAQRGAHVAGARLPQGDLLAVHAPWAAAGAGAGLEARAASGFVRADRAAAVDPLARAARLSPGRRQAAAAA